MKYLLLLLLSFQVSAQTLHFKLLDQNQGLPDEINAHYSISKDGLFWTSSRSGLNRYDGKNIKLYRPNQIDNTLDPNITSSIFEDCYGRKWFTCTNALLSLDPATDELNYYQIDKNENRYYYAFHLERDSFLWLIANEQLYTINIYDWNSTTSPQPKHDYDSFVIYPWMSKEEKVKGLIRPLIEIGGGLELLRYSQNEIIKKDSFFITDNNNSSTATDTFLLYLHIENDTSIWVPSSVGLIHFNPENPVGIKIYKHDLDVADVGYRDAKPWQESYLWLISNKGELLLFDIVQERFLRYQNLFFVDRQLLSFNSFNSLYIDSSENLWISSFEEGLLYTSLRNSKFAQLIPAEFRAKEEGIYASAIISNEDQSFWVLLRKKGIYKLVPDSLNKYAIEKVHIACCDAKSIYAIHKDSEGDIWIIDNEKITIWNPSENTFKTRLSGSKFIYDIVEWKRDSFWVLELNKVFTVGKSEHLINTDTIPSVFKNISLGAEIFYENESNLLFVSQSNSVLQVFDSSPPFKEINYISTIGVVNGFYKSANQPMVWLASSNGLYKYFTNTHTLQRIQKENQSLNQSFLAVIEDDQGAVWLSSFWGLIRYNEVNDRVDQFSQSDGLSTMHYKENVSLKKADGTIYFGGSNGVTMIDPDAVQLNPTKPKVTILEAKVNEEKVSNKAFLNPVDYPRFNYKKNSLGFHLAALEYSDPEQNRIEFYVIKNNKDTLARGESDIINLPNLQWGTYRLDCYAYNSDNIGTIEPFQLFFRIKPPWYLSWAALITWIFLLFGGLYLWYQSRIRQIERRETAKRRAAEFKQKEAEYKQLVAETETAVLRLQMNPHFIFNSMNSISSYILQKDIDTANDYLHRFAQLMRKILELSEHTFVDLDEEIEFLKLYLDAEQMRVGRKLKYDIYTADSIDIEEILIPTMILQPFIENAIWHGISVQKEGGSIWIRFSKENQYLLCEVEDNGVGRDFHKTKRAKGYKSKAIEITKRRLELLYNEKEEASRLQIFDLKDEAGKASGTKVQLFIPIQE